MDNYVNAGNTINHILAGTVSSGDLDVIAELVGVAQIDGVSGDTIPYAIEGVFRLAKATGAIAAGDLVDWDVSALKVSKGITPAAGDVENFGIAMEAAASGATLINVKLIPGGGTFN